MNALVSASRVLTHLVGVPAAAPSDEGLEKLERQLEERDDDDDDDDDAEGAADAAS